jgi:hypothetical protein
MAAGACAFATIERGAFIARLKPKLDEAGSNATARVDELMKPQPRR